MVRHPLVGLVLGAFLALMGLVVSASSVRAQPVTLDVTFTLTDLDYHPLPNLPVRVVFGSDPDWQSASAGKRFVTDAKGQGRFTTSVTLDMSLRKYPTNYWSSLVSTPQRTDHLLLAAEMEFADFHWLYAVDLFRFREAGDTMIDSLKVYTPDERGRFVRKAEYDGKGWKMADLKGLMLTHPGYEIGDFMLAPDESDASGRHWTLKLAFRKSPPPVRR